MKSYFLLAGLLFSTATVFSQRIHFNQGFGLSASTATVEGAARGVTDAGTIDTKFGLTLRQFGIVYYPRVDMLAWKDGSLSMGSPVMVGIGFTNKYRSTDFDGTQTRTVEGITGAHLVFNVPVVMDLNIGLHSASEESRKKNFGFYVGAGYGYSYTKIKTSVGKVLYDGFDPVLRAGIRMGGAWENRTSLGFNLRGAAGSRTNCTYELHFLKEL